MQLQLVYQGRGGRKRCPARLAILYYRGLHLNCHE